MSRASCLNPRVFIDNTRLQYLESVSFNQSGNSQATSLSAKANNTLFDGSVLFGKPISFFLDEGDGVPIFRGFIKDASTSDKSLSISAVDVRGYLSSQSAKKIKLTDRHNYDGYTLGAFLKEYIDTEININSIIIGTDKINETNPMVSLSGIRGDFSPLDLVLQNLNKSIDENSSENPLGYNLTVVDDGEKAHIKFSKEKLNTEPISLSLSESNGILSYTYKKRPKKFIANLKEGRYFQYGSAPSGPFSMELGKIEYDSPDEAREAARLEILKGLDANVEISINSSKGYYLDVGDNIYVNVNDTLLNGVHRVVGKTINYSNKLTCKLQLNKTPSQITRYI